MGSKFRKNRLKENHEKKLPKQECLYFHRASAYKVFTKGFIGNNDVTYHSIVEEKRYPTKKPQPKFLKTPTYSLLQILSIFANITQAWYFFKKMVNRLNIFLLKVFPEKRSMRLKWKTSKIYMRVAWNTGNTGLWNPQPIFFDSITHEKQVNTRIPQNTYPENTKDDSHFKRKNQTSKEQTPISFGMELDRTWNFGVG